MRTYLGKFVNNGEAPVFVASVKEDGFDVTEELLRVAAADEAKYYSAPEVNDELAAMDAEAGRKSFCLSYPYNGISGRSYRCPY